MKYIRLFFILPVLFLPACMIVNDYGSYWDQGIIDPAIAGYWNVDDGGECTGYILDGDHYKIANDEGEVKTLKAGASTYMMNQDESSKMLFKYKADQNKLIIYFPVESKKQLFIETYPSDNFLFNTHTLTIKILDEQTFKILGDVGDNTEFWKEEMILTRRNEPCPVENSE